MLGLTVALRLLQRGQSVTLYEREVKPGGLAAGFRVAGTGGGEAAGDEEQTVWLEKFYHHLFRTDRAIIQLIGEVGLGSALEWHRPLTMTLRGGKISQLDSPLSVLRFPPIGMADRLRMAAVLAALRLLPTPRVLEGRRAARWVRMTMGTA
ncbi:MAG: FAD-dependent oxidoreductase, partial [Ktedonobacterales bacterium]|nr:FAD-dependent oxidoreductase [Ktedonobacterales bacterium]